MPDPFAAARKRSATTLRRVAAMHQRLHQENTALQSAAREMHDRMNSEAKKLRASLGGLTGSHKVDEQRAYLYCLGRRGSAAQAAGTLKGLKKTIRPLQ